MNRVHEGHERLVVILSDGVEEGDHLEFDDGIHLTRQSTDAPLFAVEIDGDLLTIFRADHASSTTILARQLRQVAAAHRQGSGEAAAEGIADGGGHSLH